MRHPKLSSKESPTISDQSGLPIPTPAQVSFKLTGAETDSLGIPIRVIAC